MELYEIRLHAGGYWTEDNNYVGGETHLVTVEASVLKMSDLKCLLLAKGYTENMDTFSYFPLDVPELKKVTMTEDSDVTEMLNCLDGIKDIYVVRSDDPNFEGLKRSDDAARSESDDSDDNLASDENDENGFELEPEGMAFHSDNEELDDQNIEFHVGQVFQSKDCFKKAVDSYAIRGKLNIAYKRSESKKVSAICDEDNCEWKIYASVNSTSNGQFVVRSYVEKHTCTWSGKVRLYTAKKIANTFLNEFRLEPIKSRIIKGRLDLDEIKMSKYKCQRAREHCFQILENEHVEQFSRLWDYVLELRESNPGSTIILGTHAQVFEKFYACFHAQKCGWKNGCRRIIHLDGTHLKGRTKGQLLCAVGRDANDGMYPIAWAIVSVENKPNWIWFLELLRDDLDFGSGNGTTLVSDQQKGLISAIQLVCPDVEHRHCARHIWENLRKRHGDTPLLRKTFWKLAKSYNTREFENKLEDLKKLRPDVHAEIHKYARHWSRAFFQDCIKSDVVENNICETFNNVVSLERYKHVFVLLEFIRRYVMRTAKERLEEIQNYKGSLPPRIKAQLELRKKKAAKCISCPSGRGWYEVDHGMRKYIVNVRGNISCSCRQYDLSGIPCAHIIKALSEDDKRKKPEDFVLDCFTPVTWKKAYEELMKPVNGINMWKRCQDVTVLAPPDKRPKGRQPENKRKLESWEKAVKESKKPKRIATCSNCGASGHNKKRCSNMVAPKEYASIRGRGRPRKTVMAQKELEPSLQSQSNENWRSG